MLIYFVNYDKEISIGYRDWIVDGESMKIENGQEITIRWPSCDSHPPIEMLRKLVGCTWAEYAAKVIGTGSKYAKVALSTYFTSKIHF